MSHPTKIQLSGYVDHDLSYRKAVTTSGCVSSSEVLLIAVAILAVVSVGFGWILCLWLFFFLLLFY